MKLKRHIDFINEDYKDPDTGDWTFNGNLNWTIVENGKLKNPPDEVLGDFKCIDKDLTTLKGAPKIISGDFNCNRNILKDLKEGPTEVEGDYNCEMNILESLEGAPKHMSGNFNCSANYLETFEGGPEQVKTFSASNNQYLTSLKGSPKAVGESFILRDCSNLESLEGAPEVIMEKMYINDCKKLKSLYGLTHRIGLIYAPEHLKIEEDFLNNYDMAVLHKGNYWKELLDFVLKNSRDIDGVNWPEGFITDDIRKSATTTHKYNL